MRIACVTETYPPEINGVSLTVQRSVQFLRRRGHRVELIRPRQPGDAPHCDNDDNEEWRTGGMPIPLYPGLRLGLVTAGALARRFVGSRPDLVHVVTPGPLGYAAARAAVQLGLPLTTDFRTNFHCYSAYYRLGWLQAAIGGYLRAFHNQARRTFVPSQAMQRELTADGFQRLTVVGRGVDGERFSPARRSLFLREVWGAGDERRVLLYVGRLAREKNIGLALRAFMALRPSHPGLRMVVVGDGPLRRRLAADYPAAQFVGAQHGKALASHYASADLFLFPSLSETFGNVTLEALASGLAVIAFDAAAAGEYIVDGENGLTVAPGAENASETAFIEAVGAALTMPDERFAALRARARASVSQADWGKVLESFESHLIEASLIGLPEQQQDVALA